MTPDNTKINFPERIERLWKNSGLTQQELADRLLIDRSYLNRLMKGKKQPSDRLWHQITLLEKLGVPQGHYFQEEATHMIVNETSEPTRDNCEEHLRRYLDRAETIAGGVGHAWVQLQLHFSITDLERLKLRKEK